MKYIITIKIINKIFSILVLVLSLITIIFIYQNFFKAADNLKESAILRPEALIKSFDEETLWQKVVDDIDQKKGAYLFYSDQKTINPFRPQ